VAALRPVSRRPLVTAVSVIADLSCAIASYCTITGYNIRSGTTPARYLPWQAACPRNAPLPAVELELFIFLAE
jgi:hypothetical protein